MSCEDCLAVLEEYFDGELEPETAERVGAHVAACADCSEALDALDAEQVVYARYRRDIEPSPALWQSVAARISAEKTVEPPPDAPPLLPRLWAAVAGVFVLPRFSPALAGSLSLVAVCAVAGWLWFSAPQGSRDERANAPQPAAPQLVFMPEIPEPKAAVQTPVGPAPAESVRMETKETLSERGVTYARRTGAPRRAAGGANVNAAAVPEGEAAVVNHEHPTLQADVLAEFTAASAGAEELPRRPLNSLEDIEVARHLEKAQLLLRSFTNADEGDSADLAYEKRVSKELLSENILLRRESEGSAATTKQLLNTLEPFLLDIANLEDQPTKDDVRVIKERMQKKEIIAALHVY